MFFCFERHAEVEIAARIVWIKLYRALMSGDCFVILLTVMKSLAKAGMIVAFIRMVLDQKTKSLNRFPDFVLPEVQLAQISKSLLALGFFFYGSDKIFFRIIMIAGRLRSEEHTPELQSQVH